MNMTGESSKTNLRSKQAGAAAVEFALLFPLLFAILYGSITYGYAFFIQQQLNFAAETGAQAGVAVLSVAGQNNFALQCATAQNAVTTALINMSGPEKAALSAAICGAPNLGNGLNGFSVTVNFNFLGMLPAITLPGGITVPVLPAVMTATATVVG